MINLKAIGMASVACAILAGQANADTYVRGYHRQDGTYVQPHYRSDPDGSRLNNWGSYGNVNPYTGEYGTRNPYIIPNPLQYVPRDNGITCHSDGFGTTRCY